MQFFKTPDELEIELGEQLRAERLRQNLTMHDIALKPANGASAIRPNAALELAGTVKTYRYLDEDETKAQEAAAAPAQGASAPANPPAPQGGI